MILDRNILTEKGLKIEFSGCINKIDDVPLKGSTEPIVDIGMYDLIFLIQGILQLNNRL